ncbi:Putative ribonuclease H protein [Dendrobium catenatum]|uniref:Ribonuclease H protein n=1 Tax=Dendrobium catenatum TaxID=906689 RepID=A0A2I0WBY5_9ASPA|nr:Putative ribonuclease H protein [Dendrobium catenatum]
MPTYLKLNADGSVGISFAGFGGIIRDNVGQVIVAYAGPLSPCKVIFAELMGLLKGLYICNNRGFLNIEIEVDALLLIQIIKNVDVFCPQFFYFIRKICMALPTLNYMINHVFRQGNACVDCLAKHGSRLEEDMEFGTDNLPHILKGFVNLDKIGLPYIRSG